MDEYNETYWAKLKQYPELNSEQLEMLRKVIPSVDRSLKYKPCQVRLKNDDVFDCVYILPAQSYIKHWGCWPEDDASKKYISISDVVDIKESPYRIPPLIANQIYSGGESGMGYCTFTFVFKDRSRQNFITGNAIDFINLPFGKSYSDVDNIILHDRKKISTKGLDYYWCLFGYGKSDSISSRSST